MFQSTTTTASTRHTRQICIQFLQAAESEVSFDENLDGSDIRIGIIRTRWNDEHVSNLVTGCKKALADCNVKDENIFETEVPGSFELPLAARFLALSGTVDAIVTAGVLIKGDVSTIQIFKLGQRWRFDDRVKFGFPCRIVVYISVYANKVICSPALPFICRPFSNIICLLLLYVDIDVTF